MKRTILTTAILTLLSFAQAGAQEPQLAPFGLEDMYPAEVLAPTEEQTQGYTRRELRDQPPAPDYYPFYIRPSFPINWQPAGKYSDIQRYTLAIHPFAAIASGMKIDFEYEFKTGKWFQTSLIGYYAPHREDYSYWWGGNRYSIKSGFDSFYSMWGVGTSLLYKHVWSRRGWYYSTGLVLEYYNVKQMRQGYMPYEEDGLKFYRSEMYPYGMSFVKPTALFNFGKHIAIAPVCFLDLYIGVGISYAIYDRDKYFRNGSGNSVYYDWDYQNMYGFARRGFVFNAGFRLGFLMWDKP